MLLKLEKPKIISDVIGILSALVTEVRIKVNKEGLSIVAVDPANVALISFKLPASSFSSFEVDEEVLGVDLNSFRSILKRASSNSSLVMKTEDNKLTVEIQDKIKRTFNLALINIDKEKKEMPSLEFGCSVVMSSKDFSEAIEDCSVVADSCSFLIDSGKFIVKAKGLNSAKAEFSDGEAKIKGEKGKSKYSLEYLQKFIKSSKLAKEAKINFSDDYPLKLEFNNDECELAFVLAPRVETEG